MAARNLGGNPIAGTNAGVMSVSKMGSAQTAMVKFDSNGQFVHAIMKPCGNPVAATPKPPAPKPVAKCESLKAVKISDNRFRLEAKAMAKDGAKINGYHFTVMHGGQQVFASMVASKYLQRMLILIKKMLKLYLKVPIQVITPLRWW